MLYLNQLKNLMNMVINMKRKHIYIYHTQIMKYCPTLSEYRNEQLKIYLKNQNINLNEAKGSYKKYFHYQQQ